MPVLRKLILPALLFFTVFQIPSSAQTAPEKGKAAAPKTAAASPAKGATVETRVENYLRNLYAWGPDYVLKVGPPKPSPIPDLLEVPVTVSMGGQSDTASVYVSKTGNFLVRGELTDMSVDPF